MALRIRNSLAGGLTRNLPIRYSRKYLPSVDTRLQSGTPTYRLKRISLQISFPMSGIQVVNSDEYEQNDNNKYFEKNINKDYFLNINKFINNNILNNPIDSNEIKDFPKKALEDNDPTKKITTCPQTGITFDMIGGHPKILDLLRALSTALRNPQDFRDWGTKPPKGILFWGPPGTGKTLIAKAMASELNAEFFQINITDVGSKWYGEAEKLMAEIFKKAVDSARKTGRKSLIYFDEIDAIAPDREGAHEVTQRVIQVLLTQIDGMISNDDIIVIGSTNRLDKIDPALRRAGRLDRLIEVPLPDKEGRRQIFMIHSKRTEAIARRSLYSDNWLTEQILDQTEQLSGADIAEILRRVLEKKAMQQATGQKPSLVTSDEIITEIAEYERTTKHEKEHSIGFRPNGK